MNKANYTNRVQRKFPLSTEGLDFIQLQIMLAADYVRSAGGNYILSGCGVVGGRGLPGIMILNDEILTFVGGDVQGTVRIVEQAEAITAEGSNYPDSYIRRHAEFGQNLDNVDTFDFASLQPFPTNKFLAENSATKAELEEVRKLVMPKGAIIMWSGSTTQLPAGFVLCDGRTVNDYGVVPDLRGRFIVGFDAAKSNLPENNTTTTENYGKVGNRGGLREVALALTQIPSHTHTVRTGGDSKADSNTNDYLHGQNPDSRVGTYTTSSAGGNQAHENRPPYYVLAFIIKVV
jgi:microcystin-dependent protein